MKDIYEFLDTTRQAMDALERLGLRPQLYMKFTDTDGVTYQSIVDSLYDIENFIKDNFKDYDKSQNLIYEVRHKTFNLNPTKLKDGEIRFMYGGFDEVGYLELILSI